MSKQHRAFILTMWNLDGPITQMETVHLALAECGWSFVPIPYLSRPHSWIIAVPDPDDEIPDSVTTTYGQIDLEEV